MLPWLLEALCHFSHWFGLGSCSPACWDCWRQQTEEPVWVWGDQQPILGHTAAQCSAHLCPRWPFVLVASGCDGAHKHPVMALLWHTLTLQHMAGWNHSGLVNSVSSSRFAVASTQPSPTGAAPALQQPRAKPAATGLVLVHAGSSASHQGPGELFC